MKKSWKTRLSNPNISYDEWRNMVDDSIAWNTCAVGEACGFPTRPIKTMLNSDLGKVMSMGIHFAGAVQEKHYDTAYHLWKKIQRDPAMRRFIKDLKTFHKKVRGDIYITEQYRFGEEQWTTL